MPDTTAEIELTRFGEEHLDGALALSQQVDWPHRRQDWQLVMDLSHGTAAFHKGKVVGTAFVTPFGPELVASNMIIVDESLRGQGLGRRLMTAIMSKAKGRENRLIATPDGLPLYKNLGFNSVGEIAQHQGLLGRVPPQGGVAWDDTPDHAALAELDAKAFRGDRSALLDRLITVGRVATLCHGGRVSGFAGLRRFGRGEVAGPVIAQSAADARALLAFVFSERPGAFMRVDVPASTELGGWLRQVGLPKVGGGTVMTTRRPGADAVEAVRTFALTSQALG